MSKQDGAQSSTKQRRSRITSTADQQNSKQAHAIQRPANEDKEAWKHYWATVQPKDWFEAWGYWRTEPEIDAERQKYLHERRTITPNIEQGIYPFKDIELSRADVEWLLATPEHRKQPVDWTEETQKIGDRLDLRGANLCGLDLSRLPLTGVRGGLNKNERMFATVEMREMAAVHLEGANLHGIHLERADLYRAHLERANLYGASLERAYLIEAYLTGANLYRAVLVRTRLRGAHLQNVRLGRAHLVETELEDAVLSDEKHIGPRMVDANWSDVNLSVINWSQMEMIGDECEAQQSKEKGEEKDTQIALYQTAVRANRQLAVILQSQGLNEQAARFAYRAQICQRYLLFLQLKEQIKIKWLASLLFSNKPKGEKGEHMIATMIIMLGALIYGFGLVILRFLPTHSLFFPSDLRESSILLLATIFGILFISLSILMLVLYYFPRTLLALFFLLMGLVQAAFPISIYLLLNALLTHLDWLLVISFGLWIILIIPLFIGRFIFNSWFFLTRKLWKYTRFIFSKFRPILGIQVAFGRYIFVSMLDLIAGYGYKPGRSVIAYLLTIVGFAALYTSLGHLQPFPDSFVFSLASFHGRGFFPNFEGTKQLILSDPLVVLAAIEAVIGLLIEISFIATFTQRYFGK